MARTLPSNVGGKETVQTTNRKGSENYSGKHNPKVTGSSPVPATKQKRNLLIKK